jgi:rare lipoprotein A
MEKVMPKNILTVVLTLSLACLLLSHSQTHAGLTMGPDRGWPKKVQRGLASWYSEQNPGINKHTANNEIFDSTGLTAAMWEVPFHQMIRVTNLENGKSVVVRINDRGPHERYVRQGRIIDLSKRAFSDIAPLKQGLIPIHLEFL